MDSLDADMSPTSELDRAAHTAEPSSAPSALSPALWSLIALLSVAGCLGLLNVLSTLWYIWTTDPLRSIGMFIPPIGILLTLRVWRQMGWPLRGRPWGLLLIALAFLLSVGRQLLVLHGVMGKAVVGLNPLTLPLWLYGSGLVLLFAGSAVWRKAWFPLGLLLLSQPVPTISTQLIDLPLQHISAEVARAFATFIGFAPNTPQLRLMFSPNFGMFIAPGCDGIRGAFTMGYMALLLGYLKRVAWPRWVAYVTGAVLLGYLFNFSRLCMLVIYYRVALGHPSMENVAKQADYGIGSCLFLVATLIFLHLANRRQDERPAETPLQPSPVPGTRSLLVRCALLTGILAATLALPGAVPHHLQRETIPTATLLSRLPSHVGSYDLTRTWYEQTNGIVKVVAGSYSAPGANNVILAVWVVPNVTLHDPHDCYLARGLDPRSMSVQQFPTASGSNASFRVGSYNDGVTDSLISSASCSFGSCSDIHQGTPGDKFGLVFVRLHPNDPSLANGGAVSFLIRVEELHSTDPQSVIDQRLTNETAHFVSGMKIETLIHDFQ